MRDLDTAIQIGMPPILLIAQSIPLPAGDSSVYLEAVRTLGVLAVLAWYLWYTTSVSNPKILEAAAKEREANSASHRAEREAMTRAYREEVDQKRADFLAAMVAQRKEFQESLHAATETFRDAIDKVTCRFDGSDHPCSNKPSS